MNNYYALRAQHIGFVLGQMNLHPVRYFNCFIIKIFNNYSSKAK